MICFPIVSVITNSINHCSSVLRVRELKWDRNGKQGVLVFVIHLCQGINTWQAPKHQWRKLNNGKSFWFTLWRCVFVQSDHTNTVFLICCICSALFAALRVLCCGYLSNILYKLLGSSKLYYSHNEKYSFLTWAECVFSCRLAFLLSLIGLESEKCVCVCMCVWCQCPRACPLTHCANRVNATNSHQRHLWTVKPSMAGTGSSVPSPCHPLGEQQKDATRQQIDFDLFYLVFIFIL